MKKVLTRILKAEKLRLPERKLQHIIDACQGDIRNAIHTLQFHMILHTHSAAASQEMEDGGGGGGEGDDMASSKRKAKRRKKSDDSEEVADTAAAASADTTASSSSSSSQSVRRRKIGEESDDDVYTPTPASSSTLMDGGRDEMFSIFHALGKVLHSKDGYTAEHVVDRSGLPSHLFTEWIHENYLDYLPTNDFDAVEEGSAYLSDADLCSRAAIQRFGDVSL